METGLRAHRADDGEAAGHPGLGRNRPNDLRDRRGRATLRHRHRATEGIDVLRDAGRRNRRRGGAARRADEHDIRRAESPRPQRGEPGGPNGSHARCRADCEAPGIRRRRAQADQRAGRSTRSGTGRQNRSGKGPRRPRARQARTGHARHALHDRLDDETADVAADGAARRPRDVCLGHPGHEAAAVVRAWRSGRDSKTHHGPHHVRLHRPAALGHGVHLRVEQRHGRVAGGSHARDEADDRLRRNVPVQQPHGRIGRLHRRPDDDTREGFSERVRIGDARGGARAGGHDVNGARPRRRSEARACPSARTHADVRHRADSNRAGDGHRFGDARGRRVVQRARHLALDAAGTWQGKAQPGNRS